LIFVMCDVWRAQLAMRYHRRGTPTPPPYGIAGLDVRYLDTRGLHMTHRSPLVTLAAVAAFFAGLLIANFVVNPGPAGASQPAIPPASAPSAAPTTPPNSPSEQPARATPSPTGSTERGDEFPHKAVYVGRTKDGEIAVAVAVLGDRTAAYICDGKALEAWFRGKVVYDTVTLTSRGGDRIQAQLDDGGWLKGSVRHEGKTHEFQLRLARPPAGIYRAKGSKTTIGWIVLPNGDVVGVATESSGKSGPAPTLPADRKAELDGDTVPAGPVNGDSDV
jgi:hypothetical protein